MSIASSSINSKNRRKCKGWGNLFLGKNFPPKTHFDLIRALAGQGHCDEEVEIGGVNETKTNGFEPKPSLHIQLTKS